MKNRLTSALLVAFLLFTLTLTACGAPAAENSTAPTASPAATSLAPEIDIAALCPGAELLEGLAVRDSAVSGAQADVQEWLDSLKLD